MKQYCVINMDIVGSRLVKDREQLQINLNNHINYVNDKYRDTLAAPAAITLGDEWQLITGDLSQAYNLVHEFQQLLWKDNIELYAGMGIGSLSTAVSEDVRQMDGPCFHSARQAINTIKDTDKLKNKYTVSKQNKVFLLSEHIITSTIQFNFLDFYYSSKSKYSESVLQEVAAAAESNPANTYKSVILDKLILERTINLIIENNEILKSRMTKKQKDIYVSYFKIGSYRKVVDENLDESISGISQKLNSAAYFTIQRNHQMVSALLNTYDSMGE